MHPPPYVCRRLFELDPEVRLAWLGWKPTYVGELNPGTFCIVQLWRKDHFGSHERPLTPNELWYLTPVPLPNGDVDYKRVDRGPVFNRNGGVRPDWNQDSIQVVYRLNLKDFGISNEDVVSGAVLHKIDRFYRPLKDRIEEDERETYRAMRRDAEDLGREAGKRLHRALNRHDVTYTPVPYEDQRKALIEAEMLRAKRDRIKDLL